MPTISDIFWQASNPVTRPLIYVAGPITSDPWGCVRTALEVEAVLDDFGCDAYLPQLSILAEIVQHKPYERYIDHGLNMVSRCDGLWRIPGDSPGADKEVDLALHLDIGIPIYLASFGGSVQAWVDLVKRCHATRTGAGR